MFSKFGAAAAVLILFATPALADSTCGYQPIAPSMPSPASIKSASVAGGLASLQDAVSQIKHWQGALKTYRDCLNAEVAQNKRNIAQADPSKKADRISDMKDAITANTKAYDSSVDEEEHVVNEFHASEAAYCMRSDIDKSICPGAHPKGG